MDELTQATDRSGIYQFRFDRLLGRGGTGSVYRGHDTKQGSVVAVKVFTADFFRNKLHMRDFAKSVAKFSKFNHVNVVRMMEFITGEEGECLVMDYIDGPDMRWYVKNRPWNLQERLVIAAQICNGLGYLHEHGVIHHDMKPANVLFTRKGIVKLTDYSLCGTSYLLALFDAGVHEQVTPMYVAPELLLKQKATPQSDLYALGVTFYVLFTGQVPFEVDSLPKLYQCHLRVAPNHPTMMNKACPHALGDIIMRLMDKKPENRYENCDQLRIAMSDIGRSRI